METCASLCLPCIRYQFADHQQERVRLQRPAVDQVIRLRAHRNYHEAKEPRSISHTPFADSFFVFMVHAATCCLAMPTPRSTSMPSIFSCDPLVGNLRLRKCRDCLTGMPDQLKLRLSLHTSFGIILVFFVPNWWIKRYCRNDL